MIRNNIPFSFLLEITFAIIAYTGVFWLLAITLLPAFHKDKRQQNVKKYLYRIKLIAGFGLFVYYVYQLFQFNTAFTIVFLLIMIIPFWNQWRDLISGMQINWGQQLREGDKIIFGDMKGQVKTLGRLNLKLETNNGLIVSIPNRKITDIGYSKISSDQEQNRVEIIVEKSVVNKLGGSDTVKNMVMSSPWFQHGSNAKIIDHGDESVKIITWASNPELTGVYKDYLKSILILSS